MDTRIKKPQAIGIPKEPIGWKCSADGKHFVASTQKKCKYCLPIYEQAELNKLLPA